MALTREQQLEKLQDSRDSFVEVYESLASDDTPDNGYLSSIHQLIITTNQAINNLPE